MDILVHVFNHTTLKCGCHARIFIVILRFNLLTQFMLFLSFSLLFNSLFGWLSNVPFDNFGFKGHCNNSFNALWEHELKYLAAEMSHRLVCLTNTSGSIKNA